MPRPSGYGATEPHPTLLTYEQEAVVAMAARSEMPSHLQFQHLERVRSSGCGVGREIAPEYPRKQQSCSMVPLTKPFHKSYRGGYSQGIWEVCSHFTDQKTGWSHLPSQSVAGLVFENSSPDFKACAL